MQINPNLPNYNDVKVKEQQQQNKNVAEKNSKEVKQQVDTYTPSKEEAKVTYEKPTIKVDTETIQKLKAESDRNIDQLRNLVRQLLERQGVSFNDVLNDPNRLIEVDEQARAEAAAAISDGGPLSAEKVSDDIVEFAKAISGGDKSKLETLKGAIEEGFKQAASILGGELPEVSQKTYELVMEKLDAWENE